MSRWTCPLCGQEFVQTNQNHSCNERTIESFLEGKSERAIAIYHYFIQEFSKMGDFRLHPTKHAIGFAARIRFGCVFRLGKDYVDILFSFDRRYDDNLCFHKIAPLADSEFYNHYIRLYSEEDLNEEVRYYMKMALDRAS